MSLYNMINGVQITTFFILPLLGKHPDEYPRFRDCFPGRAFNGEDKDQFGIPTKEYTTDNMISVYTRVGGGNREDYQAEIDELRAMPEYLEDYDDDFDSTFATFVFKVPERFLQDFMHLKNGGKLRDTSDAYKAQIHAIYPKLKEKLDEIFSSKPDRTAEEG